MPAQTGKSEFFQKMGGELKKGYEAHKGDETTFDTGGRLPAGIENGVAQLKEIRLQKIKEGKQNAGKFQLYAVGIVKRPVEHNGQPLVGARTTLIIPLYATPTSPKYKTAADNYGRVMNEVAKFGVSREDMDPAEMEATLAALQEAKPHFKFRTWQGGKQEIVQKDGKFFVFRDGKMQPGGGPFKTEADLKAKFPYAGKDPLVNEVWNGVVDFVEDGESTNGAVEDGSPEVGSEEGAEGVEGAEEAAGEAEAGEETAEAEGDGPEPAATEGEGEGEAEAGEGSAEEGEGAAEAGTEEDSAEAGEGEESGEGSEAPDFSAEDDLDVLAAAADEHQSARDRMVELGGKVGVTPEAIGGAATWTDAVALIKAAQTKKASAAAKKPAAAAPAAKAPAAKPAAAPAGKPKAFTVKSVWGYHPLDKTTGKPGKKQIEVEIVKVDKAANTAHVRSTDDPKKEYTKVPLARLVELKLK